MSWNETISQILPKIIPTPREKTIQQNVINRLSQIILEHSSNYNIIDVYPCGSVVKGTNLQGQSDIDLFIRLHESEAQNLDSYLRFIIDCLRAEIEGKYLLAYAEHPYAEITFRENQIPITVNIVPTIYANTLDDLHRVLSFSSLARTPFHTQYALKHLKGLENEIRLMKFFLKNKFAYGIFGFTGWLCELLTMYYQTFHSVLENISKLRSHPIDLEKQYSIKKLQKKFAHDRVTIIDPIDPNRNAAAGIQGFLGEINLQRVEREAGRGLMNPDTLFTPSFPLPNLILTFRLLDTDIVDTNIHSHLGGIVNKLSRFLLQHDYHIADAYIEISPPRIFFLIKNRDINSRIQVGPPVNMKNAVLNFKQAHPSKKLIPRGNRYIIENAPIFSDIESAITAGIGNPTRILELTTIERINSE